jgi:hypothetical protein
MIIPGVQKPHCGPWHRSAVHMNHASAALARITTDVRAGQSELVADHFDEQRPRVDFDADRLAIERARDFRHHQTLLLCCSSGFTPRSRLF